MVLALLRIINNVRSIMESSDLMRIIYNQRSIMEGTGFTANN